MFSLCLANKGHDLFIVSYTKRTLNQCTKNRALIRTGLWPNNPINIVANSAKLCQAGYSLIRERKFLFKHSTVI